MSIDHQNAIEVIVLVLIATPRKLEVSSNGLPCSSSALTVTSLARSISSWMLGNQRQPSSQTTLPPRDTISG